MVFLTMKFLVLFFWLFILISYPLVGPNPFLEGVARITGAITGIWVASTALILPFLDKH